LKKKQKQIVAPQPKPAEHPVRFKLSPRNPNQGLYLQTIYESDLTLGLGPAGTGKTFLAVGAAIRLLLEKQVQHIILTRPAVEAGEKLGFLPGSLQEKVDPYLRPLYDALYEMLGAEHVDKLFEKKTIEIAPLAFMRGRTLKNSFIILDEGQNTTVEQMKMFLTRMGDGSRMVVNGDLTQIDLPKHVKSGLLDATQVLKGVRGVGLVEFGERDIMRHPMVQRIVKAYDRANQHEMQEETEQELAPE